MVGHDILVVGASAGGIEALRTLLARLPTDLPASLFVVQHLSPDSPQQLPHLLAQTSALPVQQAIAGAEFAPSQVYVAPPDLHLQLFDGRLQLTRGPRENRARPAIDPLFRSAAVAYGSRVVGVLLSGYLDDGVSGLEAIQRCGGLAVVQEPTEALAPQLPSNALRRLTIDHCAPAAELAPLLARLVRAPAASSPPPPPELLREVQFARGVPTDTQANEALGRVSTLSCPSCGGPLWRMGTPTTAHYRCHTGHAFSPALLLADQSEGAERALWVAYRLLQERVRLLEDMATSERARGHTGLATLYDNRAGEVRHDGELLLNLIVNGGAIRPVTPP